MSRTCPLQRRRPHTSFILQIKMPRSTYLPAATAIGLPFVLLLLVLPAMLAFLPPTTTVYHHHIISTKASSSSASFSSAPSSLLASTSTSSSSSSSRRDLVENIGRLGLGLGALTLLPSLTVSAAADRSAPIAVLGARGKTGKLIVQQLLAQGKCVRALSYQPFEYDKKDIPSGVDVSSLLTYAIGDVTKPETLSPAIKGASAVIFAASASKNGGKAQAVDCDGVENIARSCIAEKIPRLLVISSGAVTKPDSFGYKVTNLFARGIMGLKLEGENRLRALYASFAPPGVTYTVLRPGGLSNDKGLGVSGIELNQKDTIIGEISRVDVAATAVAAIGAADAADVTFEVYEIGRRTPLQKEFPEKSGMERRAGTWEEIFKGLVKDSALQV